MSDASVQTVAIVGAGQAGFQVAASLRELGFAGCIRLFGEEPYLPYQRPPLSKTYLKEDVAPEKMYFRPATFFADKSIDIVTGARVEAIDRTQQSLHLAGGETTRWDHLVLATGVTNRRLVVVGADLDGVATLRGLDDAEDLRHRLRQAERIVIVGGGVIGLEIAALARTMGKEVVVAEIGDRLAGRIASPALSAHLLAFHRETGSDIRLGTAVERIEGAGGKVTAAVLSDGARVETSLVLVSIGVAPNAELAAAAGLRCEDGIVVDAYMRTSDPAILAIGDCARFAPPFGTMESVRLESVQNAIDQGRCAAETIMGHQKPYDALPWFWSDQGILKVQIAGLATGCEHTVVRGDEASGAFSVFCFAGDKLIGVEAVNRAADFVAARRVLSQRKVVRAADVAREDFDLKALMR